MASQDRKTFVLDTNTLLHDPEALAAFGNNDVVVPLGVLEDLAHMKHYRDELSKNARVVFKAFDTLKKQGKGELKDGVVLPNGTCLRIQLEIKTNYSPNFALNPNHPGYRILMAALLLHERGEKVVFVSKDLAMRVKAEAMGIEAEDYENKTYSYETLYRGLRRLEISKHEIDTFYKDGQITLNQELKFSPNEYCVMQCPEKSSAVGKYDPKTRCVVSLLKHPSHIWGITPVNVEQKCALDLLLRDDIKLVTLLGPAGTGKTLLALAAGLRKVFDENTYTRILISRPIVPLGRDIGYLPGLKEEKLVHWMQPIYDNLEYLCASGGSEANETLRWVNESNKVEMEAVTYIRGRSLPKMYMIIDEAQNLTPHEVKTIISRAGKDTKVVLTGDPTQIDNPYLDRNSNGLSYLVGRFQEQRLFGHMFMEKTERSELAALAAEVM
ncbi:MAG: PhoH family protein [Verrucomicrobia bacterium]|nr:PhoH family protein [Verrucomicrobiota bacterium]MBS0645725.1 PhoH family protein [Verrucomicrobiota bacterium]